MKLRNKIIISVIVVIVLIITILNMVISHVLPKVIQQSVIPAAEKAAGVDIEVGKTAINVIGGSIGISSIKIGNPAGFMEPSIFSLKTLEFDIGTLALLKGMVKINKAYAEDIRITIVRNAENNINALTIKDTLAATSAPPPPPTVPSELPASKPAPTVSRKIKPVSCLLKNMKINTFVEYIDYKLAKEPLNLAFELSMQAENIGTVELPNEEWGTLTIHGNRKDNPLSCVIHMNAKISPVTNPEKLSFDITGSISNINTRELGNLTSEMGIQSDSIDINLNIQCRNHAYLRDSSSVTLWFTNPTLTGRLANQAGNMKLPQQFPISIPFGGTVDNPDFAIQEALIKTVLGLLGNDLESAIESITNDESTKKALQDGFKTLQKLFQ